MPRGWSFDLLLANSEGSRRFALIEFSKKDDSIYVIFPEFAEHTGLLSRVVLQRRTQYPTSVSLTDDGRVTKHLVKYSHHPSGRAHFSLSDKVKPEIGRQAVPLADLHGHLFTIQFQGFSAFPFHTKVKRHQLQFEVSDQASAVKIIGGVFQISRATEPEKLLSALSRPEPFVVQLAKEGARRGLGIAPPIGDADTRYFIFLHYQEVPLMSEEENHLLTFAGGFDPSSIVLDHSKDTEMLVLSYPCDKVDELAQRIGSVDLPST